MQNSRGFRALKVWMGFKLLGRKGFTDLIDKASVYLDFYMRKLRRKKTSKTIVITSV